MKKHLNNKGYLLVEIILASVLAMVIAYFMTDLTIKLKNKNDDLLVRALVYTDQAIIYNTIMPDLYAGKFSCDKLTIDGNKFTYDGFTNIVSDYASFEGYSCNDEDKNNISIAIPIEVEQLPDDNFNVTVTYEDGNFVYNRPSCKLSVSGTKINAEIVDNGSGIVYSGWSSNMSDGNGSTSKNISTGTHTYYLKDGGNNQGSCSITISNPSYTCSKSASSKTFDCDSKNYNNEKSVCSNGVYGKDNCSRKQLWNVFYSTCYYDEFSGKYLWREVASLTENSQTSCSTEDLGQCSKQDIDGDPIVTRCEKNGYKYSGEITCSSYCSSGTFSGGNCYLYNKTSCASGWTSSKKCEQNYILEGNYCYKY